MTVYYKAKENGVEWYATKYDACKLVHTGKPYRFQKGSGRAEMLNTFGENGKTLGEITQAAAAAGYDPNFVVGSILKHIEGKDAAFAIEAPEGTTLAAIKAVRQERRLSPEQAERVAAAKQEAEAKRAAKASEREAKKAQKEADAAQKKAQKEAAKKEAEAAAKAQTTTDAQPAADAAPASGKGKGKGKAKGTVAATAEANPEAAAEAATAGA